MVPAQGVHGRLELVSKDITVGAISMQAKDLHVCFLR